MTCQYDKVKRKKIYTITREKGGGGLNKSRFV